MKGELKIGTLRKRNKKKLENNLSSTVQKTIKKQKTTKMQPKQ